MRLAVSNIAWPSDADDSVASMLTELGVEGVEIAPLKMHPQPLEAPAERVREYRAFWEDRGLPIVAMQALLFGRNDLTIFENPAARTETLNYLKGVIRLAEQLGAGPLVFGSPKNRRVGTLARDTATGIADEFFRELGRYAAEHGTQLCLEPNPVEYGCDFLVNSGEVIEFVNRVAQDGLGVHLDVGGMTLAGESPDQTLSQAGPRWQHFHISEPYLAPIGTGGADHSRVSRALRQSGYDGWISIEMKQPDSPNWLEILGDSIRFVRSVYGLETTDEHAKI